MDALAANANRPDEHAVVIVDAALRKIIQEKGGKTEEQTNKYVEKLKADKRYNETCI
ncbi:MAG TPA: hypothetical protein VKE30_07985 [Chthoniobacterales bacterium]|nr:hypothetical protein [Chthoniobacterales bacterium]